MNHRPRSGRILKRAALSALILSTSIATRLPAAPKVPQVTHGSASFRERGSVMQITAGNGAIINYKSFDIGKGEKVQFIQPNDSSRVLNRVTSADPSRILGSLVANGTVYLVNPNGIYFENGAMVNVGKLYAAAGHLSDTSFLSGQNQFTQIQGDLHNAGQISGANGVSLVGQHVANFGSVVAEKGAVAMVAGSEVLIGERDGHVFVRASGGPAATGPGAAAAQAAARPGVLNAGQVQGRRAIMGAGDLYSVALTNTGVVKSASIALQGNKGAVNVAGTLDASSAAAGTKGGDIAVTGKSIALQAATLKASGPAGGGTVKVGGDFQGRGTMAHAATTTVDSATTIQADATVNGSGGQVVLWSDQSTQYAGAISARGAGTGNGGSAEVSSKGELRFEGTADLTAPFGQTGTLLLDPTSILVANTGSDPIVGGTVTAGPAPTVTISPTTLVNALKTSDVLFLATNDIVFRNGFDSTSNAAAHNLSLSSGTALQIGEGATPVSLLLKGSFAAVVTGAGGTVSMIDGSVVQTSSVNGDITLRLTGGGAGMNLSKLDAGTGRIYLEAPGTVTEQTGANSGLLGGALALRTGTFDLQSTNNSLVGVGGIDGTLAGDTAGTIYRQSGGLKVGTITSVPGTDLVGLKGGNTTVQSGDLNIASAIALANTAVLELDSGAVTQSAAISGKTLVLEGSGSKTLTLGANNFQNLAADVTGAISYRNSAPLTISSGAGVTGAKSTGDFSLQTTGALTIAENLTATGSTLTLNVAGASETGTAIATASNLLLQGTGNFSLGNANAVGTIAGSFNGTLNYRDKDALTVGTVGATSGLASTGKNITLQTGGNLTVAQNVSAGTADVGLLASGGTVTQTGGTITAKGLAVTATTVPTLTSTSGVDTVAANISAGGFSFEAPGALTVGTVAGVSGVTAAGDVNLTADTNDLSLTQSVTAPGFAVNLTSIAGSVVENGGIVSASKLDVSANNASTLTGKNLVGTVTATVDNDEAFTFYNDQSLTAGKIDVTGNVGLQAKGDLNLTGALGGAASTVRLVSSGDLKQSGLGLITAAALGVRNLSTTAGDIVLTLGNDVPVVSGANAAAGKALLLRSAGALSLESVTGFTFGNFSYAASSGLAGSGATGLAAGDAIALTQAINAPSGTVYLLAPNGVTQSGSGIITAGTLGITNSANGIALTLDNQLGTVGVENKNGGSLTLVSASTGTTTVGNVAAFATTGFSFAGANGLITSGGGNVDLRVGGKLQLSANISASGSTVRLLSEDGVAQSSGSITATGLGVRNGSTGDIVLEQSNSVGTGGFAALNSAAGGAVSYKNGLPSTSIGSIGAETVTGFNFIATDGVTTTAGGGTNTIQLEGTGNLTLNNDVKAPGSDVRLKAGQQIFENGGSVTANGLALVAGAVPVQSGFDHINTLAANITGGGGSTFSWTNATALTIGSVLGVDGITYNGAVSLSTNTGNLTLAQNVKASGLVRLNADAGGVNETTGAVQLNLGGGLLVTASQASTLGGSNSVSNLAARLSGAGDFTFFNQAPLTVGTVDSVDGIVTTGGGGINLQAVGNLSVNDQLTAPGGTVRLVSSGDIRQNASGLIGATTLIARGSTVRLLEANTFANVAGASTASPGFVVRNSGANDVTLVSEADLQRGNFHLVATNGLQASANSLVLYNDQGGFALNAPISAANASVFLVGNGGITQGASGTVTAKQLTLRNEDAGGTGDIILARQNQIASLAAFNGATGKIIVNNASTVPTLTISSVAALNPGIAIAATNGVTTTDGDIAVGSGGALKIDAPISAGSQTVRLLSGGGQTVTANGSITADALGASNVTGGSIQLTTGMNVSTFAASNTATNGSIFFASGLLEPVTLGTVGALAQDNFDFTSVSGATADGSGTIGLQSQLSLNLAEAVKTGANGRVLLVAAGDISQDSTIETGTLGVRNLSPTDGAITLTKANSFTKVAGANAADGKELLLVSSKAVTVDTIAATSNGDFSFGATSGLGTNNGNLSLQAGGDLTLQQSVAAGTADVLLTTTGAITEPGGVIQGRNLEVQQTGAGPNANISLAGANNLSGDVALKNAAAGEAISFTNLGNLVVATVGATVGVTSNDGEIALKSSNGAVQLNQVVQAGSKNISLSAESSVAQNANGSLTAGGLAVQAGGAVDLTTASNNVTNLAANVSGAGNEFSYTDADKLVIGTVNLVTGITANGGNIKLTATTGDLEVSQKVKSLGAEVTLSALAGKVSEDGSGSVVADGLAVKSQDAPDLAKPNAIARLAAQVTGAGEKFTFTDSDDLAVDTVAGVTGVTTSNGAITITSTSGSLAVRQAVDAGVAEVKLSAGAGTLSELSNSGRVHGTKLTLTSGSGTFFNGLNTVQSALLTNNSSGGVQFNNLGANLDLLGMAQSGFGTVAVTNSGALTVTGSITAPGAVALNARNGAVIEDPQKGKITAGALTTGSTAGAILTHDVSVGRFGAGNSTSGAVTLVNNRALTLTGIDNDGGAVNVTTQGALSSTGNVSARGAIALTSTGTQELNGGLSAEGAITLRNSGAGSHIHATGTIEAGGDFLVRTQGATSLEGAVEADSVDVVETNLAVNDVQAKDGDLVLETPGTLYLTGTSYEGKNVFLNRNPAQPRVQTATSTILLTSQDLVTINADDTFAVGYLEKLIAFGSLSIQASSAILGDTAARSALTVSAGDITLMDREPSGEKVGTRPDRGLNIVADTIDFGGQSVQLTGQGNGKAAFAVSTGTPNVSRTAGVTFFTDSQIDQQFPDEAAKAPGSLDSGPIANLPFQPVAGGVVDAQVVAALAGALPEQRRLEAQPEAQLSAATVEKLLSLGVSARFPDDEEKRGIKAKRALFKQLLGKRNPTDADYLVVVNRIGPAQVTRLLDKYDHIVGPQQELKPRIQELFKDLYGEYVEKTGATDAGGFGNYLIGQAKRSGEARNALAVVGQFRELFGDLGKIGFTPKEIQIAESRIANSVSTEDFPAGDFLTLIGVPQNAALLEPPPAPALQGAGDTAPDEKPGALPAAPSANPSVPSVPASPEIPSGPSGGLPALPPATPGVPGVPAGPSVPTTL